METEVTKLVVPWGLFDYDKKEWRPNYIACTPQEEQYKANVRDSYLDETWNIAWKS